MRWKIFLFLFVITILSNAAPIEEKDGKTIITLKIWNLPDSKSKSIHSRATLKALEQFKQDFSNIFTKKYKAKYKANPKKYGNYNWDNVEIKIVVPPRKYIEGLKTDKKFLASEKAPDVLYINYRKSCNFIRNGFLLPLDEYYKTLTPEEIAWRVDPKVKTVACSKGPNGKVHWWTMPYAGVLSRIVTFNKAVFDKHNIPYPDKNWTWNDFLRICKKTTDISKNKYGIRLGKGAHESWFWTTFLWSAGGEVTAYNPKTQRWEYAFNSDAAVKALDFYTQLSAYAYKDFRNANDMWNRGDIAMQIMYIENMLITNIDLKKYGIVPVPLGPTGIRGSELNSRMFGINSQIKSPVIKDAAWEYMRNYDSPKSQKIKVKMLVEDGKGILINPIYLKKFGYDAIAKKVDPKLVETLNIAIATGVPEPYRAASSNHVYEFMTYALNIAAKLDKENKLDPIGSNTRDKQLKLILTRICTYANKVNNQR